MEAKIIKRISIVYFIFLILPLFLAGQQYGRVILNLSPQIARSQIIYVSDFDFIQKGNVEYLFHLNWKGITN